MRHALTLLTCALSLLGCSDDGMGGDESPEPEVPACVEYELDGCAALYPATYDQVWNQSLGEGCAQFGTACHAQADAAGAQGGMLFVDAQQSWEHMLSGSEDALIVPGDPLCSPLFVRLVTDDASIRMPPGTSSLPEGALCSIGTWISEGAEYEL